RRHGCTRPPTSSFLLPAPRPPRPHSLPLHAALPISTPSGSIRPASSAHRLRRGLPGYLILFAPHAFAPQRQIRSSQPPSPPVFKSEEHTSELQSRENLVCRLLLEKKNKACLRILTVN